MNNAVDSATGKAVSAISVLELSDIEHGLVDIRGLIEAVGHLLNDHSENTSMMNAIIAVVGALEDKANEVQGTLNDIAKARHEARKEASQ